MRQRILFTVVLAVGLATVQVKAERDLVGQRQEVFEQLEAELDHLDDHENWQHEPERWLMLAESVRQMKGWYPPGSREDSRARKAVWSKPEEFQQRLDDLAMNLERMGEAGVVGNAANFEVYKDELDSSCLGCHIRFKTLF